MFITQTQPHLEKFAIRNSAGFTLLEVLLAIVLFALLMSSLFSSFSTIFSTSEAVDDSVWAYDMATTCMNRMIEDLQSIYVTMDHKPPGFVDDKKDDFRVEGEETPIDGQPFSRLRFTSYSHINFSGTAAEQGIAEIIYYVQARDEGNGYILRRADNLPPFKPFEESKNDPILCENLLMLSFQYVDAEGTQHRYWNSDNGEFDYATPVAIDIQLKIGNETNTSSYYFDTTVALPIHRAKKESE